MPTQKKFAASRKVTGHGDYVGAMHKGDVKFNQDWLTIRCSTSPLWSLAFKQSPKLGRAAYFLVYKVSFVPMMFVSFLVAPQKCQ